MSQSSRLKRCNKDSDAVAKDDGSSNPSATSRESKYIKGLAEVGKGRFVVPPEYKAV